MAATMKNVDNLKQILKDAKEGQTDLYSHLLEVFNLMILHYPDDALDKLEEVSYLIKHKDSKNPEEWLLIEEMWNIKQQSTNKADFVSKARKHFDLPQPEEEGGDPVEIPTVNNVPDLLSQSRVFEWAGISFGEKETYRLQKSLAELAQKTSATNLKFWGKIYGTEKDYYIAEGLVEGEEEGEERPADFEARGSGVNQFVYWVTDGTLSDWTQLPDLNPNDVSAARSIKVLFTGDLEREIITNPFFFGKEKHYLRAQIARISHGTTIIPNGLYKLGEAEEEGGPQLEIEAKDPENEEDNFKQPETEDQTNPSNWLHFPKSILNNNRTGHAEPVLEEGDEREPADVLKEIIAKDPYEPRLKPITEDDSVDGSSAWTVNLLGQKHRQATHAKMATKSSEHYGVVVVKSLRWPGSTTCWKGKSQFQIYVGDGLKNEDVSYYPVFPPAIPVDPEDNGEQPEPNPTEAPAEENKEEAEANEGEAA